MYTGEIDLLMATELSQDAIGWFMKFDCIKDAWKACERGDWMIIFLQYFTKPHDLKDCEDNILTSTDFAKRERQRNEVLSSCRDVLFMIAFHASVSSKEKTLREYADLVRGYYPVLDV